jgi:hypothetical protein
MRVESESASGGLENEERYVLELNALKDGDVILEAGYALHSAAIKAAIESSYSHVMIYLERSIFEATKNGSVFTRVPNRFTVKSANDLKVLRYNDGLNSESLDRMINHARGQVATYYSVPEAVRSAKGKKPTVKRNGQFCSRLVAEILSAGGVKVAKNIHYCSPADIERTQESGMFTEVQDAVRKATPAEIAHAYAGELHPKHQKATVQWTKRARKLIDRKHVQNMNDIFQALIDSRSLALDKQIASAMIDSGYLDAYGDERAKNAYRVSIEEFFRRLDADQISLTDEIIKEVSVVRNLVRNIGPARENFRNTGGFYRVLKIEKDICEQGLRHASERLGVILAVCAIKRIESEEVEIAHRLSISVSRALSGS